MKRYAQLHHLLVAAAAAALLLSPLAHAGPAAPDVPGAIAVEVPYTADYHFWKATGR